MLKRLLWRCVLPACVAGLVVYVGTSLLPKVYTSYQTLYFPLNPAGGIGALGPLAGAPSGGDVGALSGLGGALSYPLIGSGSLTAAGIVNSHTCEVDIAQKLDLPRIWGLSMIKTAERLATEIVTETDRSGLLLIRVNSDTPERCVQINHAIYEHLQRRSTELSLNASAANARFVEQRLTLAEDQLNKSKGSLISVMKNTPLAQIDLIQKSYFTARDALASATQSREEARTRLAKLESEYEALPTNPDLSARVTALTTLNPTFSELATELQKRRLSLEDAIAKFTDSSPELSVAKESFRNAQELSKKVIQGASSSTGATSSQLITAKAEFAALETSVAESEKTLNGFESNLQQSPQQYTESQIARHEFDENLSAVAQLKQELERAKIMEGRDPSRFAVVDDPFVNHQPVAPRPLLYAGIGAILVGILTLLPFLARLFRSVAVDDPTTP